MKIVVIGGTGLIGRRLVTLLAEAGHEAVPASPSSGVDTLTGAGLDAALSGADVVVDVSNSPSFADDDVLAFFRTSTTNLLAAASRAGVGHYVALSVVGSDRAPGSGYLRAKVAQEQLIAAGPLPWTVLRATQFFEFAPGIAASSADGDAIRLPSALIQPVAADDVAATLALLAPDQAAKGIVELGGPERIPLDEFVRRYLSATGDARIVVTDPSAPYFGARIDDTMLVTGPDAHVGQVRYTDWLAAR
ncbi:SDR family oxidoreductase [Dactylosporangium sp. CA-092794]|uniref:SDR family oxidoreductase n=1 Tax=Dactylosporangium sp. CA-092794 TaxID=3239929 RepID=UPI003D8DFC53